MYTILPNIRMHCSKTNAYLLSNNITDINLYYCDYKERAFHFCHEYTFILCYILRHWPR